MTHTRRVGIFSGVFDPVHAGHIGFALKAIKQAQLDEVYFLVEAKPRRKIGVTHVAHRIAMVKLAIRSHPQLKLLELPDRQFSAAKTLPRLNQRFAGQQLVLLVGSDMLEHMPNWPLVNRLLDQMELAVARRQDTPRTVVKQLVAALPVAPKALHSFVSPAPAVSSARIRESIRLHHSNRDILPSLRAYIASNWLYELPSASSSSSSS